MKRSLEMLFIVLAGALSAALALSPPDQTHRYAVILRAAPLAQQVWSEGASRSALSAPAAETHRRSLLKGQESLRTTLKQRKIVITGSVQTLLNAVFVNVPASRITELKAMPDVAAVIRMPRIRRTLNTALDLVSTSA